MTAMIETTPAVSPRVATASVDLAGVSWPLYKLQALAVAVVVAVITLVAFASLEVVAWASAITLVVTWWVARHRAVRGPSSTR